MTGRLLPARDYAALKTAFSRQMEAIGGQTAAAALTRVGQRTLSTYANLGDDFAFTFAPTDVVADLEAEAVSRGGRPLVSECLAGLAGFALERRAAERPAFLQQFSAITGASAEAIARMAEDLADGTITPAEAAATRRSLKPLIDALQRYDVALGEVAGPVEVMPRRPILRQSNPDTGGAE